MLITSGTFDQLARRERDGCGFLAELSEERGHRSDALREALGRRRCWWLFW